MKKRFYDICTKRKNGSFDIAMIDYKYKVYTLCLNCEESTIYYLDCEINPDIFDESIFDDMISTLKKQDEIDFSRYGEEVFERFYTHSKINDLYVDMIEIDVKNKRSHIYINHDDRITDGYDEFGEPIYSNYVSRFIFDILSNAIKTSDFTIVEHIL
ncbi:MAG: hypothetical protein IJF11_02440 [Clostridia bacterium]|nr:hypothetical protein [Clostridia bacterium]